MNLNHVILDISNISVLLFISFLIRKKISFKKITSLYP